MSSNHVGNPATFTTTLSLMTDGDAPTAALFRTPLEKLLDNDANLQSRLPAAATQAEQETGTDTEKYVTPGRQHYHPSAAKFWARVSVTAGTPSTLENYNLTSITDNGTGDLTVTIANNFGSGSWCAIVSIRAASPLVGRVTAQGADGGSCQVACTNLSGTPTDPDAWNIVGYGDQ